MHLLWARVALFVSLAASAIAVPAAAQPPSQALPRFTSAVEVTSVDASVFDSKGRPVTDLTAADFVVRIDGSPRRVVSVQWTPMVTAPTAVPPPPPEGYSSNDSATGGRLIMLVVDQPNIRFGGTLGIRRAINEFLDRLEPSDRAAVIGIGLGAPATSFTADKARLKQAVERMTGQYIAPAGQQYSIGAGEATDIRNGVLGALDRVVARECQTFGSSAFDVASLDACASEVERQANDLALEGARSGQDTITTLRNLLVALKAIDAPKTMLFISEGFLVDNQQSAVAELGSIAGAARTTIYTLKLDDQLLTASASEARAPVSRMEDRAVRSEGLEILAGSSRGALINIVGNGAGVFDRIGAELSGYYLLAVESVDSDHDGRPHPIRVDLLRKDLTIRSRRALLMPREATDIRTPRQAVAAALSTPLPMSALPLRVATFSLRGPETGRVQLLIHADIGTDYPTARAVTLAYTIADLDGRIVDSQAAGARLPPIMTGVPSPLQYAAGASLPPGDYVLKLAVSEADRIGTVEHTFHAGTSDAGGLSFSDLMVGGPNGLTSELLQPTIGYTVVFGAVHAYLEAYGAGSGALTAHYEIAATADGEALFSADVPARTAGGSRAIFTQLMPVRQLPPGKYVMRATMNSSGAPVTVVRRSFEVAAPAVLMTSASTSGGTVLPVNEVYLPVNETLFVRPFDRNAVINPTVVDGFRAKVPEPSRAAFDQGVKSLSAGAYPEAERSFKQAVSSDEDSSAVLTYLGAVFAATGHDVEAAGAWQTSLIAGSESPDVYDWLAASLMRSRNLAQARSTLEEAVEKWPSDVRFAKPLALIYATFGQGQQAVRTLERHLAEHKDDTEALAIGVEWIYQLDLAGATAHSRNEDRRLARTWADGYLKTSGPQAPLVRQWMDYLDKRR